MLGFDGRFFELKVDKNVGWNSLRRDGTEFLRAKGAIVFEQPDGKRAWKFPDLSNVAHDEASGRMGYVGDGKNLVRLTPKPGKAEGALYLGSITEGRLRVFIFLAPDVTGSLGADGSVTLEAKNGKTLLLTPLAPPKNSEQPAPALSIVQDAKYPDGIRGTAEAVTITGFAVNSVSITYDAPELVPPPIARAQFDVHSSGDPDSTGKSKPLGPINGVTNPIYGPDVKVDFGLKFDWLGTGPFEGVAEFEVINALGGTDSFEKKPFKLVEPGTKGVWVPFAPKFPRPGGCLGAYRRQNRESPLGRTLPDGG